MDTRRFIARAFPRRTVKSYEVLAGGLINTSLKVEFKENFRPVVLRVYRDGPAACRKEMAIHSLVRSEVPVAEIIHAECSGTDDLPAFAVLEYVEGLTFQQLKRTNDRAAIRQAAASVGETLARIGRFRLAEPGELLVTETSRDLTVGQRLIDGRDPVPRILDRFLAAPIFECRAGRELTQRLHDFIWSHAFILPKLENECSLVHNDFGNRNILVRQENGNWRAVAILDWELAISGSPLLDVGHFLRYESDDHPLREPHFSRSFVEHGGRLPDQWQQAVKLIDLTGLVESLTHKNLPPDAQAELLELIHTTLNAGTRAL